MNRLLISKKLSNHNFAHKLSYTQPKRTRLLQKFNIRTLIKRNKKPIKMQSLKICKSRILKLMAKRSTLRFINHTLLSITLAN